MKWPWWKKTEFHRVNRMVNPSIMMLETAKEILTEVFHAPPADVEDMIQRRLEERSWTEESEPWPAAFRLGE